MPPTRSAWAEFAGYQWEELGFERGGREVLCRKWYKSLYQFQHATSRRHHFSNKYSPILWPMYPAKLTLLSNSCASATSIKPNPRMTITFSVRPFHQAKSRIGLFGRFRPALSIDACVAPQYPPTIGKVVLGGTARTEKTVLEHLPLFHYGTVEPD
jgi:hypothetical protein